MHPKVVIQILHDVTRFPEVNGVIAGCLDRLHDSDEFETLTIDCTVKVALTIVRPTKGDARGASTTASGNVEDYQHRCVLTVKGRTGATVVVCLLRAESIPDICTALEAHLKPAYRSAVKHVAADRVGPAFFKQLKGVFPNLTCLYPDTVHWAMRYESAFARNRSPGSKSLRAILAKLNASASGGPAPEGGHPLPYSGGPVAPLTLEETRYTNIIGGQRVHEYITAKAAAEYLSQLDLQKPYEGRVAFLKTLACFTVVHAKELVKTGRLRMSLRRLVMNLASPFRWAWLSNVQHHRRMTPVHRSGLVSTGTTGNEAFHKELRWAFRQNVRHLTGTITLHSLTLSQQSR